VITLDQARTLSGKTMMGAGGEKLGTIDTLYADREDGDPTFATVHTGMFGSKTHFVPLAQATLSGDTVTVPYGKDLVGSAPNIDPDAELEPAEEQRLYQHYGVGSGSGQGYDSTTTTTDTTTTTGTAAGFASTGTTTDTDRTNTAGTVGHDTSGPTTDNAMTRSEERLEVGTQQSEIGRARLRKYIVSERETVTVPVSHEEVRVEREPITDANAGDAYDGPALSEEEHEVVLTGETPVVNKETVPVERVRLDTETVTSQERVSEEVRKEQIDMDGDVTRGDRDVYPAGTDTTTGSDAGAERRR
jgi:uncharacterized protein (TIGR02271 family)